MHPISKQKVRWWLSRFYYKNSWNLTDFSQLQTAEAWWWVCCWFKSSSRLRFCVSCCVFAFLFTIKPTTFWFDTEWNVTILYHWDNVTYLYFVGLEIGVTALVVIEVAVVRAWVRWTLWLCERTRWLLARRCSQWGVQPSHTHQGSEWLVVWDRSGH